MLTVPNQEKRKVTKEDIFTEEALEAEEPGSFENYSVSSRASSQRGKSSFENKPHMLGKTDENLVPFDENIGLLTPGEVKKLEKYGKIVNVEESAREHEQTQEELLENMPEDIPIIVPGEKIQNATETSSRSNSSRKRMSQSYDKRPNGDDSGLMLYGEESGMTLATSQDINQTNLKKSEERSLGSVVVFDQISEVRESHFSDDIDEQAVSNARRHYTEIRDQQKTFKPT